MIKYVNKILGWIFIIGLIGVFITCLDRIWFNWEVKKVFFSSLGCVIGSVVVAFLINVEPEER